jgi:imidazolonepropionase-like amidohydrolase
MQIQALLCLPTHPPFGLSYHEEPALLVAAGLSPVDAIIGGTSLAASAYRLYGRGSIAIGMRADLVLLSANPTVDIRNSRLIQRVWVGGIETDPTTLMVTQSRRDVASRAGSGRNSY